MPPTGVGRRAQLFEIWIRTIQTENAPFAIRAALREVERLVENGLTAEQFEATRTFLKGYAAHFAESTYERLGYALDDRFHGLDGHLASFRAMLDEVTLDDVNAAVRAHMGLDNLVLAAVTNDAAGLRTALAGEAPTPVHYPPGIQKPAEILAEDEAIAAWPLRIHSVEIVPIGSMFD
jgi:zinc protease